MSRTATLQDFTRNALAAGRTPQEIAAALAAAGWSAAEIRDALDAWAIHPGLPPVPRRARTALSAGLALVEGLHLVALGMVAGHLIALIFTLIAIWLPQGVPAPYWVVTQLRWPMAALVVFLPLWLWSARKARPAPGQRRPALSVWAGHLAVFVATLSLLGDALAVIYRFLSGDATAVFLLKALVVAVIAGLVILAMEERRRD
ncbi:MAG: hypothetical protein H3C51_07305 [Rubellimicrobium sp.]|nr:hypothetical protein [Rubellimicrobium sp.]